MLLLKLPTTGTVWDKNRKSADPNTSSRIHFHSGKADFTEIISNHKNQKTLISRLKPSKIPEFKLYSPMTNLHFFYRINQVWYIFSSEYHLVSYTFSNESGSGLYQTIGQSPRDRRALQSGASPEKLRHNSLEFNHVLAHKRDGGSRVFDYEIVKYGRRSRGVL